MGCEHGHCLGCDDPSYTASHGCPGVACDCDALRTTLARLTAELAAVTSDRDMWRDECASISAELDLPPGIRPAEGELRRMLDHNRALLAERDALARSLDASASTVALLSAQVGTERTAANEWLAQLHDARRERDEARGLLREVIEHLSPNERTRPTAANLRARIAAHLEGR